MDKITEVYDFALAWVMGYDDTQTLKDWYLSLEMPFGEFQEVCKAHRWWVKSMEALEGWR